MVKTVFEKEKLRIKVDTEENLVSCEANWEDPDNTEEWFCRMEELDDMLVQAIIFDGVNTDDMRWTVQVDMPGSFIVYNRTYDVGVRIWRTALESEFNEETLTN